MLNEKFYCITAAAGHVGEGNFIPISFAVKAVTKREAAHRIIGRGYTKAPRVKIGREGRAVVLYAAEISEEEYFDLRKINDEDPYLKVKNIQEQRQIPLLEKRIVIVRDKYAETHDDEFSRKKVFKKDIVTRAFG